MCKVQQSNGFSGKLIAKISEGGWKQKVKYADFFVEEIGIIKLERSNNNDIIGCTKVPGCRYEQCTSQKLVVVLSLTLEVP